jgi:hypothetical protein
MYNARLPLISIFTILGVVGLIIAAYLMILELSPFAYFAGMGALVFVGLGRLIYLAQAIERNTCRAVEQLQLLREQAERQSSETQSSKTASVEAMQYRISELEGGVYCPPPPERAAKRLA